MTSFFKYFAIAAFVALFSIIFQAFNDSGSLVDITFQLQSLVQLEAAVSVEKDTQVVVGYGSCSDLTVRAVGYLNYTDDLKNFAARDEFDDEIRNLRDFMKSFLFYFSQGAAAERYTPNKELFKELVAAAKKRPEHRWDLGGNAPVMGLRFHFEGVKVLIASTMSTKQRTHLPDNVAVTEFHPTDDFIDDIHLIIEYKTGDEFGGHKAPRANRYIIHSDSNNPMITALEPLGDVNKYKPKLFVVSGLQMLDNFAFKSPEVRTERLESVRKQMTSVSPATLVHFEMASFVEIELLKDLAVNIFPYSDSLGMNEQEIDNLMNLLESGKISLSADSNPRVATTLDQMRKVFKILNRNYFANRKSDNSVRMLSRIHIHTLAFQMIVNVKGSQWRHIKNAASKSSLTAHRHVCQTSYVNPESAQLILDDSFATSTETETDGDLRPKRIVIQKSDPVPCWNETIRVNGSNKLEVEICVSPVFVCKEAKKTVGAGDNISAAGLVLQI